MIRYGGGLPFLTEHLDDCFYTVVIWELRAIGVRKILALKKSTLRGLSKTHARSIPL